MIILETAGQTFPPSKAFYLENATYKTITGHLRQYYQAPPDSHTLYKWDQACVFGFCSIFFLLSLFIFLNPEFCFEDHLH